MVSSCIYCAKSLGSNRTFATFPVGGRLVFDPAKGHLWVVCPHCERWNLSPLEERWEVIEQAGRLYRDTRKRVATENMGLAEVSGGATLVRVGEPLRPEFAAWRYGDQFGRRRRTQLTIALTGIAVLSCWIAGAAWAGYAIGAFVPIGEFLLRPFTQGRKWAVIARVPVRDDGVLRVRQRDLRKTTIGRTDEGRMVLHLQHTRGSTAFEGRDAERVAAIVLPAINRHGGDTRTIALAVEAIEQCGGSEAYLDEMTRLGSMYTKPFGLFSLPDVYSLAFEMALHEEAERRALHGEVRELEQAWEDAEATARISDALLVSSDVEHAFQRLKENLTQGSGQ